MPTHDPLSRFNTLAQLPPAQWEEFLAALPKDVLSATATEATHHALGAVRMAVYAEAINEGLLHSFAVQTINKVVEVTAKAMGFTYPKSHHIHF